jgi:hypothetical protein
LGLVFDYLPKKASKDYYQPLKSPIVNEQLRTESYQQQFPTNILFKLHRYERENPELKSVNTAIFNKYSHDLRQKQPPDELAEFERNRNVIEWLYKNCDDIDKEENVPIKSMPFLSTPKAIMNKVIIR